MKMITELTVMIYASSRRVPTKLHAEVLSNASMAIDHTTAHRLRLLNALGSSSSLTSVAAGVTVLLLTDVAIVLACFAAGADN